MVETLEEASGGDISGRQSLPPSPLVAAHTLRTPLEGPDKGSPAFAVILVVVSGLLELWLGGSEAGGKDDIIVGGGDDDEDEDGWPSRSKSSAASTIAPLFLESLTVFEEMLF